MSVRRLWRFSRRPSARSLGAFLVVGALVGAVMAAIIPAGGQASPPPAPNTALGKVVSATNAISDPDVMPSPHLDYLYSTGLGGGSPTIPVRTFTTLGQWTSEENAMPKPPPWVVPNTDVWSPDVRQVGAKYVMWFTAQWAGAKVKGADMRCVGDATATNPLGPFTSSSPDPSSVRSTKAETSIPVPSWAPGANCGSCGSRTTTPLVSPSPRYGSSNWMPLARAFSPPPTPSRSWRPTSRGRSA